jgi:hypothetical protein
MSTQVTVTLPDEIYERAKRLAQLSHRDVAEILAETIAVSLPALRVGSEAPAAIATLSDDEVLALTEMQLPSTKDRRLSALLERQQAATISETERAELGTLLQLYQEGLLRKAQALAEAVRRGLREPLSP